MHPVPGEAVAGRGGLGTLVLVMREDQVQAAAVDVERRAQVLGGHGRAFQVPARAARAPGGLPGRLARLVALPQGEVPRVALGVGALGVAGRPHVLEPLPGQAAVVRLGADVEVHVAAGRVGVAGLDQPPHQHDHLGHVPGGPRLDVRRQAAEHVVGPGEGALVLLGHRPPRDALLLGGADDLVVDVGDVAAERDLIPAGGQPAPQDVEADPGPDVTDVRGSLDCGAAEVQRGLPGHDRVEVAYLARGGVVEAERHAAQAIRSAAEPIRDKRQST